MTRKDTILIAVVINAGLLAILFTTAVIYDHDKVNDPLGFGTSLVDHKVPSEPIPPVIAAASTGDEVDNVLKYYHSPTAQPIVVPSSPEGDVPEAMALQPHASDEEDSVEPEFTHDQEHFIEVIVKRGDVLEKIARAHKTTVGAIKRANHLESERLSIGQVIKIPVKQNAPLPSDVLMARQPERKQEAKKEIKADEPVYYIIKSGDNPWKIAKQFGVKYDEILRLNNLDEEKARNLKIGDRIRVK
jgi:LysM repeat protein